uniref:Ap4A_phos_N domain-containing protein n=1 Tax=Steinernema glaseri TaxID=37863 RepID=A0A1I7YBN6_9BILA
MRVYSRLLPTIRRHYTTSNEERDDVSKEILQRLDQLSQAALASGDLLPVQAQEELMQDQGLTFFVRWVSTLAAKDAASVSIPGGPRDPNFNPFLPPAPALTVADASSTHNIVLNKFAVCDLHLVLADKSMHCRMLAAFMCALPSKSTWSVRSAHWAFWLERAMPETHDPWVLPCFT